MSDTQYKDTGFPPLGPDTPRSNAIAKAYDLNDDITYGYLDPEELIKFAGLLEREINQLQESALTDVINTNKREAMRLYKQHEDNRKTQLLKKDEQT